MVDSVGKTSAQTYTPPPAPTDGNQVENKSTTDAANQARQAAQDAQQQATQQAQQDQAREAVKQGLGEAAESQAAQRLDLLTQFSKAKEKLQGQLGDFIQVVETVIQESVEGYRPTNVEQGAGAYTQDHGQGFTPREQQVIREFIRELQHLVGEQGLEFSHAFAQLKVQQGGEFWKALTQVLQKGMTNPGSQGLTADQLASRLKAAAGQAGGDGFGEKNILKGELGRGPGMALAEIIRAETNPNIHAEGMLAALALLKQEGMEKTHRELVKYLRHRWKMNERQMETFLRQYPVAYFQGPMRPEKFKDLNTPLYPIIALATIPIARLLGMEWSLAIFAGVLLMVVLFLVAYLSREKE